MLHAQLRRLQENGAERAGKRSGGGNQLVDRELEATENRALDGIEPPVVLDHAQDAYESGPFFRCQEEDEAALRTLGLHAASGQRARPPVGTGTVNGGGTFG